MNSVKTKMATLKCLIYMCLFMSPATHGYRTVKSNEADIILTKAQGTIDIVCKTNITLTRCEFTYSYGTKMSGHTCRITITSEEAKDEGTWTCYGWLDQNPQHTATVHLTVHRDVSETSASDDEPIVISTTTFVCGTLAFLCIFVLLVYWKYKYYTLYYGKTWGDDDSVDSIMKEQAEVSPVILAGDHLLIT